jgi:hypothetical protein
MYFLIAKKNEGKFHIFSRKREVKSKNIKAQHNSMPAMNYFDSNRPNTVMFNHSWTVYTYTAFGGCSIYLLRKFWIDFWTRYFKTKIWMLTWKTYLLCIFQHRFDWTIHASFFSIGIYFFYFISNNNCRLLTTVQVFDIMFDNSAPPSC